jgi:hypothetical protein
VAGALHSLHFIEHKPISRAVWWGIPQIGQETTKGTKVVKVFKLCTPVYPRAGPHSSSFRNKSPRTSSAVRVSYSSSAVFSL